jgi:outer membrane biosynthesis protein TonB
MNSGIAEANFERDKNLKAFGITVLIVAAIGLLFFLISWTVPVIPPPPVDEGVEVNLGNSDQGTGNIAPEIPGPPSSDETKSNPPPASHSTEEPEQNKEVAANDEAEAPVIHTSPKSVIKPRHIITPEPAKKTKPQPTINPTPTPPRPKAVYKGGTTSGAGGNNADSYNGVRNQGIAGGSGDQGSPNGNPNSDSYTGNGGSGNSGVAISSGLDGRRFTHYPSFQDNFNQNAKVAVDITVDQSGNVVAANINPHGTTTTNENIRGIAITKAKQLKLNAGSQSEQTGTIIFTFKLQD